MRRANYRLVLPEGPLRRFRLPESFGDEGPRRLAPRTWPWSAAAGWLGICGGSWFFAHGSVDPLALLDQRWQLSEQGRSGVLVAGLGGPALPPQRAVAVRVSKPDARVASPRESVAPSTKRSNELPRVSFPQVDAHGGGFGVAFGLSSPTPHAQSRRSEEPASASVSSQAAPASAKATSAQPSLADVVAGLVVDTPVLPAPKPREQDPFEADFGLGSLPTLSDAENTSHPPVPLQRTVTSASSNSSAVTSGERRSPLGARGAFHWNGGCQRAFDTSVQQIGPSPSARDAFSGDYARVLKRLNVAGCSPAPGSSIEVCVAVERGQTAGVTIYTTPSREPLAQCLVRQVRALSFPASSGMDLVRTRFDVD